VRSSSAQQRIQGLLFSQPTRPPLDLHTLFIAQTCALAATAAMLWVSRSDADRSNGMRTWMYAITTQAIAFLLLASPGPLPATLVALVGNFAGALSVALFFAAIRQFAGRGVDRRLLVAMVAIVTVVGGITGAHAVDAAIFNGFAYAGYEWLNAVTLWRAERPETARVQRVVALFYALMALVLPLRATALLLAGQSQVYADNIHSWQVPVYVFGFIYIIITNLGFVLMCKTRAEAETRLQARTDDLTALANRRALTEEIAVALAAAQRNARSFAIVMVDVDRFKFINDTHGHAVGDATLMAFAGRLAAALHAPDRAYRYGGEEFCLLLADTDLEGARVLAQRVREQVALPYDGAMKALTASLGVTAWQPGDAADALFRRADRALYAAKAGGRNRVEIA
jgi:diguanylate cyclase (GGDEF)-like protein